MQVCFLYNHDAAHQVAHSIGIAAALAKHHPEIRTVIAFASPAIRAEIDKHISAEDAGRLEWLDMDLGRVRNTLLAPLNRLFPARRLVRLMASAKQLRDFDLLVSTERTCLMLKRRWRGAGPDFVYVPHGSGDRNVAYHPALADFDWMLLSGQKLVDQMVAHDITDADHCRVIGYPKFDSLVGRTPQRFFQNDNPVFLYNPHFDPLLSSWYDYGPQILRWFADHPNYNLIFAPHVMLFFKKHHLSPEYKKGRTRPEVPARAFDAPNILVDLDSPRLFDMSYTISADAYIGDVSSQVYEFLHRPRTVFFIDTHSERTPEPAYEFWSNGPVVKNAEDLFSVLPDWKSIGAQFEADQIRLMNYTADRSDPRSAAERGAEALAEIVKAPSPQDGS